VAVSTCGLKELIQFCKVFNKQARALVSKETAVVRRWGRETQNFEFIN